MITFGEYLNEASFEFGGKKYFSGWGKYRCDGQEISREEYMKARQAYDKKDVTAAMGTKTDKEGTSKARITQDVDLDAQQEELQLFTDNDKQAYNTQKSIEQNLLKKMKKGTYDSMKAVKLWQYMVDDAAKRYEKKFGTPGSKIFSVQDRKKVAVAFAKDFEERYDDGEFDD